MLLGCAIQAVAPCSSCSLSAGDAEPGSALPHLRHWADACLAADPESSLSVIRAQCAAPGRVGLHRGIHMLHRFRQQAQAHVIVCGTTC